jgi:hypothetical protein
MDLRTALVSGILILMVNMVLAQDKCATVPYNQELEKEGLRQNRKEIFEKWIRQKIDQQASRPRIAETKEAPIYVIPVVVHVIYYNESGIEIGNIPDEQIISQINVLNEDYRRNNPDTLLTPEIFLPVAADTRIEFRLAQRDPNGAPTTGIVRTEGPQSSWNANSIADDRLLKSLSFWPPEDYMNLWVVNLSGDFLGYAQYPVTDLPGSLPPFDRETDGVVIDYQVFGSSEKGFFPGLRLNFDQGRTTTHEVGHYLGLRHIWGDADVCGATDYCDDTPDQETNYFSCTDVSGFSCGSQDMYQNYMDYTYDICMNIFTFDQMDRMRIVMENSPRRASLLNSPALLPPDTVSNILIVREIINPSDITCEVVLDPEIRVQNIGNNEIRDFEIQVTLDQEVFPVRQFNITLETGSSLQLNLSDIVGNEVLEKGQHFFSVQIRIVNGVDSINYPQKSASKYFVSSNEYETAPFREEFREGSIIDTQWAVYNPDNNLTWEVGPVPLNRSSNNAAFIRMFDYNITEQQDWLISPVMDFSGAPDPNLTFSYSYARYDTLRDDLLEILVSVDCGKSFPFILFSANSDQLALRDFAGSWMPQVSADWKREFVDLSEFAGMEDVRIAFRTTNGYGNNLYLDNIEFHVTGFSETITLERNTMLIHPNPTPDGLFYVTFNAADRQPVEISIYNVLGKKIIEKHYDLGLNQTTEFNMIGHANGVYLVHVSGTSFRSVARIVVDK